LLVQVLPARCRADQGSGCRRPQAVAQRSKILDPEVGTAGRPRALTGLVVN